jgi:hypothetical protein
LLTFDSFDREVEIHQRSRVARVSAAANEAARLGLIERRDRARFVKEAARRR